MTRTDSPRLFLSEPSARPTDHRVTSFDCAFLFASLALVLGGCLWLLDSGASRSTGQDSSLAQWFMDTAWGLPGVLTALPKYLLLLAGSVLNSALIVLLVHSLRVLDRRVATRRTKRSPLLPNRRAGMENIRRPAKVLAVADTSTFLLSPVFR